ncbi:MAG: Asp-tRNA(Asn)/Glu-tRNA(Gln) amidotransferase subunit GatA [Anaerovoracaceae bacterium]|nr:Asp-tRNA(Asn)/Glu-tRNA(Gln) amidotransferase subunit GatA [Bacillota bacterium]MDY2670734.1 Asp-tRNA(Asn)/Glu-tRNA(Gln) amidotransferase subunit GatA [Anaerovoracaceae bacterium]
MEIRDLTALELGQKIKSGEIKVREAAEAYLDAVEEKDEKVNAYITVTKEDALARADEVQEILDKGGFEGSRLAGVPVAVKDNLCTEGVLTSAASHILDNFVPPYSATAVMKTKEAGAVMLGKANMDEFAMGGSTETSFFGACGNPWDTSRVPGGSSGGSAAAVAAGMAPYALGSDTGGSIRQPAAFTGLTGIKPTYGSVSRYGLLAYASSLDQIGPIAHDVKDAAAVLEMISGKDDRDSTSIIDSPFDFSASIADPDDPSASVKGMKIGLPSNCFGKGLDPEIDKAIKDAAKLLESEGAIVEEFELPNLDYAVPAYYIIACAEACSNLSRYDGIKYGLRTKKAEDIIETYYKSRSEGFGTEVKRRIMLGSFVLSSGYFDAYYKKALQVRGLIKRSFDDAFKKYDMIVSPVSPTTAYKIGGQISDPVAMYMADIYTVSINLTGVPSISLPCGFSSEGLPIGMQLIGDSFSEDKLIKVSSAYQELTDHHKQRPAVFVKGGADSLPVLKKERSVEE